MDLSGNHAKDGVAESSGNHPGKTEISSLSATDDHSLSAIDEDSTSSTEEGAVPAAESPFSDSFASQPASGEGELSENDHPQSDIAPDPVQLSGEENEASPTGESVFSAEPDGDSQPDESGVFSEENGDSDFPEEGLSCCSSEEIFDLFNRISELPKEKSFEKALKTVWIPEIVYGEPFQRFIRLFTDNNSFRQSVYLTGQPVTNDPAVSIEISPIGDSLFISGTASLPGIMEITIPYAILDRRRKEPVQKEGVISLNVVEPFFTAEASRAFQENIQKPDGLEKSPNLRHWSREGEQYEGECDISEFISLCGGEMKLRECVVLNLDSMEPAAGMKASVDPEKGMLHVTGTPATSGRLMIRFLYPNGQQVNLTDYDDLIEIVPSSFFENLDQLVEALQKMPPKQAMAGNNIKHEIPLPSPFDSDCMSIIDLSATDPSLNAVFNGEKKIVEITGKPGGSGAISLTFTLIAKTELGHEMTRPVKIPLFELCSDTKSMWKNLPTDSTAPYQAQDEDHAIVEAGNRTILAASKRGRTHAHHGKFRDDNFKACYIEETGWIVVAVSDGAGSAQYSREGSRIICDTFCETMRGKLSSGEFGDPETPDLEDKLRTAILDAGRQGLSLIEEETRNMAQTNSDVTVRDYSATLLGYVMKQFPDGWLIVSIGIGDGVIGLLDDSNQLKLLSCPDHGEYSGQTRFLTTSDVWNDNPMSRTAAIRIKDFKAVFSMSDGVSDPKFETENEMNDPQFWVNLWNEISGQVPLEDRSEQTAAKLSEWLDFVSRGYNDDRTIVLVY